MLSSIFKAPRADFTVAPLVTYIFFSKGQECAPGSSSTRTHSSVEVLCRDAMLCLLGSQMLILGHSITKLELTLGN